MKNYSLKDLQLIFNCKYQLSKDRFIHYFTTRYGYNDRIAKEYYDYFICFPNAIKKNGELFDLIIPKALELLKEIETVPHIPYSYKIEKDYRKIIYKEGDKQNETIFDLSNSNDIISYSELLRRTAVEIIAVLPFCTSVYKNDKTTLVFDGDLFNTYDKYWGEKSNIYIAQKNNTFKRLIYIKGKGYILNDNPNIDEERSYNSHCLTLREFTKIGNVVTDLNILADNPESLKN